MARALREGSSRVVVPADRAAAAAAVGELLTGRNGVSAVAAFDDEVALRVLAALRDLGRAAPGDLAPSAARL